MSCESRISVIIPMSENEESGSRLIALLEKSPYIAEVLCVKPGVEEASNGRVRWIRAPEAGRARQMNWGASQAAAEYLWFVHADSEMNEGEIQALNESIRKKPNVLHYFDLRFLADGPRLMKLNEFGVWFRSHVLKIPFGDQGYCISRDNFAELGGFDESAPYGEDHLWLWSARRAGIALCPVGRSIGTSARKYRKQGWAFTTGLHLALTAKQAVPQWIRCVRNLKA